MISVLEELRITSLMPESANSSMPTLPPFEDRVMGLFHGVSMEIAGACGVTIINSPLTSHKPLG